MVYLSSSSAGFIFTYCASILAYACWLCKSPCTKKTTACLKAVEFLLPFLLACLLYNLGAKYPKQAWFYLSLMEAVALPKIWLASLTSCTKKPFPLGNLLVGSILLLFFYSFVTRFLSSTDLVADQSWLLDAWKMGRLPFIIVSVLIITIICESAHETPGKKSSLKLVVALAGNSYIGFLCFLDFLGVSNFRLTFDIMFLVPVTTCLVPVVELWLNDSAKCENQPDQVVDESKTTTTATCCKQNQKASSLLIDEQGKCLRVAQTMRETLVSQQLYLDQNITATLLAKKLRWSEAKVRKATRDLGHKNFNDLINHYRVNEACKHLKDASKAHIPVSTIAMEAGYKSTPVFHRVFKERKNKTPKEYRDSCLLNQKPARPPSCNF